MNNQLPELDTRLTTYEKGMLDEIVIQPIDSSLREQLQYIIDNKSKPRGSLGRLEELAMQMGMIQSTLKPTLSKPVMLTIASDHGICDQGVSPCPQNMTMQQVHNFCNGGGGIGLFCQLYGLDLFVVDAGTDYDFQPHPKLIDAKVRKGTRNFYLEHAMTADECWQAIQNGRKIVNRFHNQGTNVIGFGEMGIGNTSPASALLSVYTGESIDYCVGPGSGLDNNGVENKKRVLRSAIEKHGVSDDAFENLCRFGGLEIATIAGGMLQAAVNKMAILVDGYITTSAALAAYMINPIVGQYFIFSHQSNEQAHIKMIEFMNGKALVNLDLRLGEGTGAAIIYPLLQGAVAMINKMTSFEEGKVYNTFLNNACAL